MVDFWSFFILSFLWESEAQNTSHYFFPSSFWSIKQTELNPWKKGFYLRKILSKVMVRVEPSTVRVFHRRIGSTTRRTEKSAAMVAELGSFTTTHLQPRHLSSRCRYQIPRLIISSKRRRWGWGNLRRTVWASIAWNRALTRPASDSTQCRLGRPGHHHLSKTNTNPKTKNPPVSKTEISISVDQKRKRKKKLFTVPLVCVGLWLAQRVSESREAWTERDDESIRKGSLPRRCSPFRSNPQLNQPESRELS